MKRLVILNKKIYDADMFFRLCDFGKQVGEVYELRMKYLSEKTPLLLDEEAIFQTANAIKPDSTNLI